MAFGPGVLLFWLHIVLVRAFCDVVGARVCLSLFVLIDFQLIALLSVVFIVFVLFVRRSRLGRSLQ
jgi:Mn2+/Fe2+ NRAMP family transporter